eukprot:TRINITY_DN21512_c0_g1_i1.p1 TRINITY_DN21512_c0_g1~~TRINITY_DN21512_c0_g1_i1.p1  ORF type:complete len:973 (+),score=152.15 TRINITY_DN21512_c0_g1_i1:142-3060(+)
MASGRWSRKQTVSELLKLFEDESEVSRLVDAFEYASIPYEDIYIRVRDGMMRMKAQQTRNRPPTDLSPKVREVAKVFSDPQVNNTNYYNRLESPRTGNWPERVSNLCRRYDITPQHAESLLLNSEGHAGRASRMIDGKPSTIPAPVTLNDLVAADSGTIRSSRSPPPIPPVQPTVAVKKKKRPVSRRKKKKPSPKDQDESLNNIKPQTTLAMISRYESISKESVKSAATIPTTPQPPLIKQDSLVPSLGGVGDESLQSMASIQKGTDFVCFGDVLDNLGTPPGRYIFATRQEWGCLLIIDPAAFHASKGLPDEDYDDMELPTCQEIESLGCPIASCVLFIELLTVEWDDVDRPKATSNRSRSQTTSYIARIGISSLGCGRVRFSPLHLSEICNALREGMQFVKAEPFRRCLGSSIKLYQDGEQYFPALSEALKQATNTIFISGWFLSPQVYLTRTDPVDQNTRLDNILQIKAFEGVKVYILLYAEVEAAISLSSANSAQHLESLHTENITVLRHRGPLAFTHHQKFVVIDCNRAFCGGLDLAWGRYDTKEHPVTDVNSKIWKGLDYRNPILKADDTSSQSKQPYTDTIDRTKHPRMPWHDVQTEVSGRPAYDIALNFIQRFNHHQVSKKKKNCRIAPDIRFVSKHYEQNTHPDSLICHVVRSISEWSGCSRVERSIHDSMINMIQSSKHSIYIENQFFISALYGPPVINAVASVLADRICAAARAKEVFKCILVIQPHGEGNPATNAFIQRVVHFQNETIRRFLKRLKSITDRGFTLKDRRSGLGLDDYVLITCIRQHGILNGVPVTSPIYVHSKLMIVDDSQILIGSANINDRSLAGDRDSELALRMEDRRRSKNVGLGIIKKLRQDLCDEHMGVANSAPEISDPEVWRSIRERIDKNASIYEKVFPGIPSNVTTTVEHAKSRSTAPIHPDHKALLSGITGTLCRYPIEWLSKAGQDKSIAERAAGTDFFV